MFKKMVSKLSVLVALIMVVILTVPTTAYADENKYTNSWCQNNKTAKDYNTYCKKDGTAKSPDSTGGAVDGFNVEMNGTSLDINGTGFGSNQESAWNVIFTKFNTVITGITGIGTLAMVLFFIWNAILLGKASSDPGARQKAVTGLIWSGVAAMVLGSALLFVGVFYGMLQ